ncbi:hypothetical protein [Actinoalloteichus hymeniacidonis]|nr:hypothetical protein [Actinoalloteichus hymeniacidonis]
MLSKFRRIRDSRQRGTSRYDHLLSFDELQQISNARVHPSNRLRTDR